MGWNECVIWEPIFSLSRFTSACTDLGTFLANLVTYLIDKKIHKAMSVYTHIRSTTIHTIWWYVEKELPVSCALFQKFSQKVIEVEVSRFHYYYLTTNFHCSCNGTISMDAIWQRQHGWAGV